MRVAALVGSFIAMAAVVLLTLALTETREVLGHKSVGVPTVSRWGNKHFTPPWLIDVYAGGGAAYMSGGRINVPATATAEGVAGTIGFRNAWVPQLNAGASIQLRGRLSAGVDLRWMRYRPKLNTTPDDPFQEMRLNPVTVAVGLRMAL